MRSRGLRVIICIYFSYIVAVSLIDGGNRSTQRKPPTCRKSLTNYTQKIVGLIFNIFYIGSFVKLCPVIAAIFFLSISTKVVSSNPTHGEMYLIPLYVIEFVSDLRQVGGFLWVLRFPPSIRLTATI
jgi:hypothetical protein